MTPTTREDVDALVARVLLALRVEDFAAIADAAESATVDAARGEALMSPAKEIPTTCNLIFLRLATTWTGRALAEWAASGRMGAAVGGVLFCLANVRNRWFKRSKQDTTSMMLVWLIGGMG